MTDADNAGILFQLRSDFRFHRLQAEGKAGEFQHSRTELSQNLVRSNAEGLQLRNVCGETGTANASTQAPDAPPSARVSTMGSQETELQTQLLTLHNWKMRGPMILNQVRSASESMDLVKCWISAEIPYVKFELSRAQTDISHLRSSMRRNQPT